MGFFYYMNRLAHLWQIHKITQVESIALAYLVVVALDPREIPLELVVVKGTSCRDQLHHLTWLLTKSSKLCSYSVSLHLLLTCT